MISKASLKHLRDIFLGETVLVYLKDMKIAAVNDEGEMTTMSGMVDGLLVDIDESFLYFGDNDGNVEKIINHEAVSIMEISQEEETVFNIELPSEEEVH